MTHPRTGRVCSRATESVHAHVYNLLLYTQQLLVNITLTNILISSGMDEALERVGSFLENVRGTINSRDRKLRYYQLIG